MPEKITFQNEKLNVPDNPVIPFIEGDGIGPDIWKAAKSVFESSVDKAYGNKKMIEWKEVLAGEKAYNQVGEWLPEESLKELKEFHVGIKGPLTTPVGGGIRSINVAIRQKLDLYVCLRPVRYFPGIPSPVKHPEKIDMAIFRENTEDIYAGIEFQNGSRENSQIISLLKEHFPEHYSKIRFPQSSGIGIKPISVEGTERLVDAAIKYAVKNRRSSITLVHKGNIMKYTEGGFREWGYNLVKNKYNSKDLDGGPWQTIDVDGHKITVKDVIADAFLQQILTRPDSYDVIATMNLNGDYISDALAAQVGGIGIAPGANINYQTGIGVFEATHGTAPKYAGQDKVNPSSLILSGEMMFRYMGWHEAADVIIKSMEKTISQKIVTYDFARLMEDSEKTSCSGFARALISNM